MRTYADFTQQEAWDTQIHRVIDAIQGVLHLPELSPLVSEQPSQSQEQRNKQTNSESRRERIAAWRTAVDRDDFDYRQFADSNAYATLRSYLPEDLQHQIDQWRDPRMIVVPAKDGRSPFQNYLLQEIAKVEQNWGLI
jgi:hypothetical protein